MVGWWSFIGKIKLWIAREGLLQRKSKISIEPESGLFIPLAQESFILTRGEKSSVWWVGVGVGG
jgi:hypothetical protein